MQGVISITCTVTADAIGELKHKIKPWSHLAAVQVAKTPSGIRRVFHYTLELRGSRMKVENVCYAPCFN
jgi:hypothetical protein